MYRGNPFFTTFYAVAKLQLCYAFESTERARQPPAPHVEVVYHLSGTICPSCSISGMASPWRRTTPTPPSMSDEPISRKWNERGNRLRPSAELPENFSASRAPLGGARASHDQHLAALEPIRARIRYAGETSALQHQLWRTNCTSGSGGARPSRRCRPGSWRSPVRLRSVGR